MTAFNFISPHVSRRSSCLTKFQEFVMVLMKLRLNMPLKDLAYRFKTITFTFEAWGGRTSDKFLTENCGFLDKLIPGDAVMADRGFTIQDSVLFQQSQLVIPAFTKGKKQIEPTDVEKTREIANVRIHVERVIGLLRRKYTILGGSLPIDFLD